MRTRIGLVIVSLLVVAGCSSAPETGCVCPKPVAYDDKTIKDITAALGKLPGDNPLHRAMEDYEDERDSLRICRANHGG